MNAMTWAPREPLVRATARAGARARRAFAGLRGRPLLRRRRSLFWHIFVPNALILTLAALALGLSPVTVSSPLAVVEGLVLIAGLAAMLVLSAILFRTTVGPLQRLIGAMARVDPLRPGLRIPEYGTSQEVHDLTVAFNTMLERLEHERRDSARRALAAQESERRRIALELHDQVGQSLTAALLQLERAGADLGDAPARRLAAVAEVTRDALNETRTIARRLRPVALDDLGLQAALRVLCDEVFDDVPVQCRLEVAKDLPRLDPDVEVVIYRVAQESATNVIRHARAANAEISLRRDGPAVVLSVVDDGQGMAPGSAPGTGLRGMRERAVLIGGELDVRPSSAGGVEVYLRIPLGVDGRG